MFGKNEKENMCPKKGWAECTLDLEYVSIIQFEGDIKYTTALSKRSN